MRSLRGLWGTLLLCGLGACGGDVEPAALTATPTYAQDIAPLMNRHCVECHDGDGVRGGGVEVDRYESVFAARVKNVCVSISRELIEQNRDALLPVPKDPPQPRVPCADWEPLSMPVGAKPKLTAHEQVLLVRWLVTGAQP